MRAPELAAIDWPTIKSGKPGCINCYLHRLVPVDDNKDRIVVCLTSRQLHKEDQNFEVITKP